MKLIKVGRHQYKWGDWKIFGIATKEGPTRSLRITYFIKYLGKYQNDFPGGNLSQAKHFLAEKNELPAYQTRN